MSLMDQNCGDCTLCNSRPVAPEDLRVDWPHRLRIASELLLLVAVLVLAVGLGSHSWTWVVVAACLIVGSATAAFGSRVADRLREIDRITRDIGGQR